MVTRRRRSADWLANRSDDATAEHDHRRRHLVQPLSACLGGDHPLAVDVEAGQAAGVEPEARTTWRPAYARPSTVTPVRSGQPPGAPDDGDAAALISLVRLSLNRRETTPSL